MILYSIGGFFNVPISFVAIPMAILLVYLSRRGGTVDYVKVLKEAPWQIIIFSIGMYIVVYSLAAHGLSSYMVTNTAYHIMSKSIT